jgi:NADH dehydrogenase/NADH:ubiquinone oxidoreductase subunit G
LANHPLDCPICDQGGECDLQDQSEKFGGDSSRNFLFFKRPVQDKDMGLFIKTIMVRCIHCTRCIRFLKDKALTNDLGTVGRGEKTEISFYFNKFLDKSLLCGNIVDICPVGALTNKNYSFKGRPWEIDEIKYSGISDTLGLNVKLAIKRGTNKIIRIDNNHEF